MIQWKNKFDQSALERGEASYLNKKVTDFEKVKGGYRAAAQVCRETIRVIGRAPRAKQFLKQDIHG